MDNNNNNENNITAEVRTKYGIKTAIFGLCSNIALFVMKFLVGSFSGSLAITADAFNNLSDAGSSVVTLVGFYLSQKPADEEHPFGHGRIEYISGLIVSFLILLVGFELFTSSIEKIANPTTLNTNYITIIILVCSMVAKLGMGLYYRVIGKKINSVTLMACMTDSISDVVATGVVLISIAINMIFKINLDGYMGLLVAVMVFIAGINSTRSLVGPLLGQAPTKEMVNNIKNEVMSYDGVLGIHDLIVHNYGPNRYLASVHVEVSAKENILVSHDLIDRIEQDISTKLNIEMVIHMDPIVTDDKDVNELREKVKEIINGLNLGLNFHDFRVVKGVTHTNLIFDVVVPYDCKKNKSEIKSMIVNEISKIDDTLCAVITMDSQFA